MPNTDILLIHPPYNLHDGSYPMFPIPWNLAHVGSTSYIGRYPVGPTWTYMPLGMSTMRNYIEATSDFSVDIRNLSILKYAPPKSILSRYGHLQQDDWSVLTDLAEMTCPARVKEAIRSFDATLFGVDLHWIVYADGAIRTLELLKRLHPASYTVAGGLTASYFGMEIMQSYPFVDFIILGDGCVPLKRLMEEICGNQDYRQVPNLLYRSNGEIKRSIRKRLTDHAYVAKDSELLDAIALARGCPLECITCGGSKSALDAVMGYEDSIPYSIDSIMRKLAQLPKDSVDVPRKFLIHDPFLTLGRRRWEELLSEISRSGMRINFLIEFFTPHEPSDIRRIAQVIPGSSIQISPESIVPGVRAFHKKLSYSNDALIENMKTVADIGELSLGVWFLAGLARDNRRSVDETLSFIERFYTTIRNPKRDLIMYNEMLFIDPGSAAFEDPAGHDYRLTFSSLKEHVDAFLMPLFKYQMNYSTHRLTRDQLFHLFLHMHDRMNRIYFRHGVIDEEQFRRISRYNFLLKKYEPLYDSVVHDPPSGTRVRRFKEIGDRLRADLSDPSP